MCNVELRAYVTLIIYTCIEREREGEIPTEREAVEVVSKGVIPFPHFFAKQQHKQQPPT